MRRATDFQTLANIAATIGLEARRGRTIHPRPHGSAYVAIRFDRGGIVLDLHTGGAERETASQMVEDLEAAMTRYGVEYVAMGALFEGGATFYEWQIEE